MISEYLNFLALTKGYGENTIKAYNNALKLFVKAMVGKRWSLITYDDIVLYLQKESQSKKPATISIYISAIRGIFSYMAETRGLVNPTRYIRTPKQVNRVPHIISIGDAKRALLAEPNMKIRLAIMMILATGMRVSEVRSLKYEDVDKRTGRTLVLGKGKKERYIYIPTLVLQHLDKDRGNIFDMDDRKFRYLIFWAFKRVGVYCSPHILRHSYASWAIDRGMRLDVLREVLGHTSLATTQVYLHINHGVIKKEMERAIS